MNVAREGERYQQGEAILRQFTRGLNSAYEPRLTPAELVHVGQRRHLCVCVCVCACVCACVCVCVCVVRHDSGAHVYFGQRRHDLGSELVLQGSQGRELTCMLARFRGGKGREPPCLGMCVVSRWGSVGGWGARNPWRQAWMDGWAGGRVGGHSASERAVRRCCQQQLLAVCC